MHIENPRPLTFQTLAAAGRTYALDLASSLILFLAACLMVGRVWRFPFDDELITLTAAQSHSVLDLMGYFLHGDGTHPPLSFLLYYMLHEMELSEAAMRLVSLGMTATALLLFHLLTLALMTQRTGAIVRPWTRLIAVLMFGLSPLALGQGDAIRWYPLFALLFSLFFVLYLAAGNQVSRLGSAVPLGLAASTNFTTAIVIIPFLVYRHWLERQFRLGFEALYWLIFSLFGSLGLITACSLFRNLFFADSNVRNYWRSSVAIEFGAGPLRAAATNILGFFGGDALGVGQAWVILPVASITAIALVREIDRKTPANPVHLFLLMFAAMALMVLPGFGKPRSFLYLAPVLAAILTFFLDRVGARNIGRAVLLASLILIASVGTIANVAHGTRPFKRNAMVPFADILDFIRTNEAGKTLIVSSDPVVVWELQRQNGPLDRCVSRFLAEASCFAADRHYDSIFVVFGQSNISRNAAAIQRFQVKLNDVIAGRRKVATIHAGLDEDAEIKSQLVGVPLDKFILTVDLYQ
jgi:hypothetical protein